MIVSCVTYGLKAEESPPFVIGHLMGQLGNQMFQIATATSLALDHGAIPLFPDLHAQRENIPLNYKHVFFRLDATTPSSPIQFAYNESHFDFRPIPYEPNMSIYGYFQSEKYFKHHKQDILQLFAPSQEILDYLNLHYSDIIHHPKTVAIHIRMYKDTTPFYHPFVGWNYILKAIKRFDTDSLFVIFSDQIAFCRKKLAKLLRAHKLVFIEGNHHFQDLYLMSLCKHNVISNSSFSWWGAYLNNNPDKTVLAPSPTRWFGPGLADKNTKDILPEDWIILQ